MTTSARKSHSVRLNDEEARQLRELGGSKWLREAIEEEYARRPAFTKSRPLPVGAAGGTVVFRRHIPFATKPPPDNPLGLESHERIDYAYVPPIVIKIKPAAVAEFSMRRMTLRELRKHHQSLQKTYPARRDDVCIAYADATGKVHQVKISEANRHRPARHFYA